jgi:hypothetical protein
MLRITVLTLLCCLLGTHTAHAQQQPSFARQVKPFLAKYCLECHNAAKLKGSLNLETYAMLVEGGKSGSPLVAGKPDESLLVLLPEGKQKPAMPPKSARQPKPEETAVLRAWVAAGAKDDGESMRAAIPVVKPRGQRRAPISALVYAPWGGPELLVGGRGELLDVDSAKGEVSIVHPPLKGQVTALGIGGSKEPIFAAASGEPGGTGYLHWGIFVGEDRTVAAHADVIHALVFSPDGKMLATCSYDRLVKLWDVASYKEIRTLKDHSDAVYGIAFSPDGKLLASAAADRAVKVWDVQTGVRLYSLSESTDWLYAVAWSPDGKHLAAAGVDKSIRVWEVSVAGGKLVQSVFAHEAPVLRLIYSPDGKTLYSLSEDRGVKSWHTATMTEKRVYAKQPEAPLALALRPDGTQLAVGRYDGALVLLDEATGKVQSEPLPFKPKPPKPPKLTKVTPSVVKRGKTIAISLNGEELTRGTQLMTTIPGAAVKVLWRSDRLTTLLNEVMIPPTTPAGVYQVSVKNAAGQSNQLPITIDLFDLTQETEPNDSARIGQKVTLPVSIAGKIDRAGDVDFFRFEARAGQEIGVQALTAGTGSKLAPDLVLIDESGQTVAESGNGSLGHTCARAGVFALGIRDKEYRGGNDFHYRLHIGDIPVVKSVFPLGVPRGVETVVHVEGVHLGAGQTVKVKSAADAAPGTRTPVAVTAPLGTPLGNPSVVVGEFGEFVAGPNQPNEIKVPGTGNGRVVQPGFMETWRFSAKKGQRLYVEVNARRLGSPLDSFIEILDAKGQVLPRATLRSVAQTYSVFRDHDSAGSGIRIEQWNDLAMKDYLLVGNELLRIRELPKNPDDDCQFYSISGQRLGFLGTTPVHHSMGTPMYKVQIHPPGTTFPPNGYPVTTLYYRNDDGGPGFGKDSRLVFDPPADGDYAVRIGDSRGQGGPDYGYRLTLRPPRPSFNVSFNPTAPSVWKGGALPINVSVDRIDGFAGTIELKLENLPPGFTAPASNIGSDDNSTTFALFADPTASSPSNVPPLKLVASAMIDGQRVTREVTGGLPKVVDPGDIVTTTEQSEVVVQPGKQVVLTVKIERRNGFAGRIPLEVRGLPYGVRVLDIGLNGILITEKETTRQCVIYAEPWVEPLTHPIVVLAKREGKNTDHAAKSVLLRIAK